MEEKSTALATREVKVGGYGLPAILEQQLWKSDELAKVANILFPVTALDALPAFHKPSLSVIRVNTDPKAKDIYFITREQLGLSKQTILKMLNAAGANYRTQKLTPDSDLDNIRWTALVWGRLPDGTSHQSQGSKAWSWEKCQDSFVRDALAKLRDNETPDAARARGMKGAHQYRDFADEQTETKALLRASRAFLSIKTSYAPEELQKPFLIARSVPDLPIDDPEVKRAVVQRMVDSTFALYGKPEDAPMLPAPMAPVPEVAPESEFEEDGEPDGMLFPPETNHEPAPEHPDAEPDYNPFAGESDLAEPAPDPEMTEEQVDAEIRSLFRRVADGGIGADASATILGDIGGLTSLAGVPLDIKLDILSRARKVKEGLR